MTLIHEHPDGRKTEFRRVRYVGREDAIDLQCRELRRDGFPYSEEWFPVSDWLLLRMQEIGSDIIQTLCDYA